MNKKYSFLILVLLNAALQGSAGNISVRTEEMSGGIRNINTREVSDLAAAVYTSIEKISAIADGFEI